MPPAIIGGVIAGAGAIGSAVISSKASKTASNAAQQAADANAQVQREIYQQTRTDLEPYRAAGTGGLAALTQRLGLTPIDPSRPPPSYGGGNPNAYSAMPGSPAPQAATAPALIPVQPNGATPPPVTAPSQDVPTMPQASPSARTAVIDQYAAAANGAPPAASGGVDYQRILAERPDVLAEYNRARASADPNSPAFTQHGLQSPEAYVDYWLANKPPEDTYQAPQIGAQPASPAPAADPNAPPPQYFQETYAQRPDAIAAPEFTRPQDLTFTDYGNGPAFSYTTADIENDPGYKFALEQGLNGVNAKSAALGKLRSGDAARALQDRGSGVAHQFDNDFFNRALASYNANRNAFESNRAYGTDLTKYGQARLDQNFVDDRSYGTNLWNTIQNRNDNIFADDRSFAANRNDQATANLFNLTNVGQSAAAGTAAAGQNYANGITNSNNQAAAARANAAIANAANTSNIFGSAANAIGSYYGSRNAGRI